VFELFIVIELPERAPVFLIVAVVFPFPAHPHGDVITAVLEPPARPYLD
jgi:hypothetical protein